MAQPAAPRGVADQGAQLQRLPVSQLNREQLVQELRRLDTTRDVSGRLPDANVARYQEAYAKFAVDTRVEARPAPAEMTVEQRAAERSTLQGAALSGPLQARLEALNAADAPRRPVAGSHVGSSEVDPPAASSSSVAADRAAAGQAAVQHPDEATRA